MCRWLAYRGPAIRLEDILFRAEHSLIDQSLSSQSKETTTNGDGFGVGWYGDRKRPGLFRSIRPAWNDFNLHELAAHITSPTFLAHVRGHLERPRFRKQIAIRSVTVAGCSSITARSKRSRNSAAICCFRSPRNSFRTCRERPDSELMFYLALDARPRGGSDRRGSERMAGLVEQMAATQGVAQALWMTLGVSDGQHLYAVRYPRPIPTRRPSTTRKTPSISIDSIDVSECRRRSRSG